MKRIVVVEMKGRWSHCAYLANDPNVCGYGNSREESIASLLVNYPDEFVGVEICTE